jgi:hypothetical protein
VGCSLCTCKCVEERRKGETHVRARSPRLTGPGRAGWGGAWRGLAWHGEARQWAWAHNVRMNSPSKFDPKPRRPATAFCHLGWAATVVKIRTTMKTLTHLGFTASAAMLLRLLHLDYRCAYAIRRAGLWNHRPRRSCTGRG